MKKTLFLFFITIVMLSCSIDDGNTTNVSYEILPIESALVPNEFNRGETYEITVSYYRPSTCHAFNDFYYVRNSDERTVAVINSVITNATGCDDFAFNDIENLIEASFNFIATDSNSYIFKFWQGEDTNGDDIYLNIEVPVID